MTALAAEALSVDLAGRPVLRNLSFVAKAGEVTAIVGPNGSGKSTLLRALTGDVRYRGEVLLNGRDIARLRPWQLAAMRGVLPQATTMAFPFTVAEVVRIGLQTGTHADEAGIVAAALARVGMAGHAGQFYQELSGGEQQRVQIARVLAQVGTPSGDGTPRWLLLDEPVASLDIAHQLEVMEIADAFAAAGGGVVAVMHDLNLTAMFAASVALLSDGRLLAQAPPAEVLTDSLLSGAYRCTVRVNSVPPAGEVFFLPHPSRQDPL